MKETQKSHSTDQKSNIPTDVAYWDLHQEYDQIAEHVEANDTPKRLLDEIEDVTDWMRSKEDSRDHLATVPDFMLRRVVQAFWALPEAERVRIMNGWRWLPAGGRDTREEIEKDAAANALFSMLTLSYCGPKSATPGVDARFTEVPTDNTHALRMHIRVGTTQAEVLAAIDKFREAVTSRWEQLTTDPRHLE